MVQTTLKRSDMNYTAFNLQRTLCLPLPRKHSPDGASIECGGEHLIAAHYSFIDSESCNFASQKTTIINIMKQ